MSRTIEAGSSHPPVNQADREPAHSTHEMMNTLVAEYASAKSRQDVDAALRVCTDDFLLYAEAFHSTARGAADVRRQLKYFFKVFPDYGVVLEGSGMNDYGLTCWGTVRMTMKTRLAFWAPTGQTMELPFLCLYTFTDGRISSERFFFSQELMCRQLGLPHGAFRTVVRLASYLPVRLQVIF